MADTSKILAELIAANKSRNNGELRCYLCDKPLDESKRMSYEGITDEYKRKYNN